MLRPIFALFAGLMIFDAGCTGTGGTDVDSGTNTGSGGQTAAGAGGTVGTGGKVGTGGSVGTGGKVGSGGAVGSGGKASTGGTSGTLSSFSFFVTSIEAMRKYSGSQNGFGGDLRYGQATGLAGADKLCSDIAESVMPGASAKGWRAFLCAAQAGSGGGAVNAIDRVGAGPWYDFNGRLVANNVTELAATRPSGANAAILNDLPNETGTPNHQGVDNHDVLTGCSDATGKLGSSTYASTCNDWTATSTGAKPSIGHSWPANSGQSWIRAHSAGGCGPSVNLVNTGGAGSGGGVGDGGGYGAIYCFASAAP